MYWYYMGFGVFLWEKEMNDLQLFNFDSHAVRMISDDNNEIWFVAMDVADILDYSDAHKMTSKLDDDEVQNRQIGGFGNRGVNLINESGLYTAILTSQKPSAKAFKKWVTSEVLPSIRKTGGYQQGAMVALDALSLKIESLENQLSSIKKSAIDADLSAQDAASKSTSLQYAIEELMGRI